MRCPIPDKTSSSVRQRRATYRFCVGEGEPLESQHRDADRAGERKMESEGKREQGRTAPDL